MISFKLFWRIILFSLLLILLSPAEELKAYVSPRLEIVPVMDGYPAGSSFPAGLFIHPPEGKGLLAPAEMGGPGPALNLRLRDGAGYYKVEDPELSGSIQEGRIHDLLVIRLSLRVSAEAPGGYHELAASFDYALPESKAERFDFSWPLMVLAPDSPALLTAGAREQELLGLSPSPQALSSGTGEEEEEPAGILQGYSLGIILLLVFAGGMALNLTPCVYPLMPITISFFVNRAAARSSRWSGVLAYWLGMVIMYTCLGLFASLSGGLLGQALTSPWLIMLMVTVLLILASSMLGFWEIRLPAGLNQIAAVSRNGTGGALLMGLSVGVLAAPCLGPFVLGLMTHVARDGRLFYGALLFLVFSLGLGLPLTVLAFFSGAISRLPGAGEWMVWVRKLFGLILILMAIYVAIPLLSELAFFILATACGIIGGVYLGLERSGGSNFMKFKRVVGLVIVVAALGFACQQAPHLQHPGSGRDDSSLLWTPFSAQALALAKEQGRPALLDFTAAWCQPCREMEKRTFPHPGVQSLLSRFTLLKVDVTNGPSDSDARQIIDRYRIRGVPSYLFVNSKGQVMTRYTLVGFVEPEEFMAHLQAALKAAGADS